MTKSKTKEKELQVKSANKSAWNSLGQTWRKNSTKPKSSYYMKIVETKMDFYRKVYNRINDFLGAMTGKKVLDLGCGSSDYQKWLIEDSDFLVSVDISSEMVKLCRQELNNRNIGVVADAQHLPFRENAFDVSLTFQALHHFPSWKESLQEMSFAAKQIAVYEPNSVSFPHVFLHSIRKTFYTEPRARAIKESYELVEFHAQGFRSKELKNFLESKNMIVAASTIGIIPVHIMQKLSAVTPKMYFVVKCLENLFGKIPLLRDQMGDVVVAAQKSESC